jgi:hypothetical protein
MNDNTGFWSGVASFWFKPSAAASTRAGALVALHPAGHVLGEHQPRRAIAGDLPDLDSEAEPKVTTRDDGSLLIDATMPISEVEELLWIGDLSLADARGLCAVSARPL